MPGASAAGRGGSSSLQLLLQAHALLWVWAYVPQERPALGAESLAPCRHHPPCSQTFSSIGRVGPWGSGELWALHTACALRCCLAPSGQQLLTGQQLPAREALPASTGASPAHQDAASLFCLALPGVMRNKSSSLRSRRRQECWCLQISSPELCHSGGR